MTDLFEQIEAVEKELRETPYHKGTEHHIGRLKARLSKLKDKVIESETHQGGGGGGGYAVKKHGDATVILIGPPSAGKSTLINKLTSANSKTAAYAFTTLSVIPGMMYWKDAKIQILDVPGLIEGAEEGKGRGKEVLSVARSSDLLLIMTDVSRLGAFETIKKALDRNGIRINKTRPLLTVDKKLAGGLIIHTNIKQDFDKVTVKEVAEEMGIKNAEISLKEKLTLDRLIDGFSKSRVYIPAIFVVNKVDLKNNSAQFSEYLTISAEKNINLDSLKDLIWKNLKFVSIYLVKEDEKPDFSNPYIARSGDTLQMVLSKLGTNFSESKTKARIWGPGSKFPDQEVSLSFPVNDGLQVRFI